MKVRLENTRAKVTEATPVELEWLDGYLTFEDKLKYFTRTRFGHGDPFLRLLDKRNNTFPSGLVDMASAAAIDEGIAIEASDGRVRPCAWDLSANIEWLRDDQFQAVVKIDQVGRGILHLPTGAGKCLGLGTEVLRYDGAIVPVEQVRVDDELMGPDSEPRRVLSTTTGRGEMYRIVPNKGASWTCNDVHVLTLIHTETDEIVDIPLNEYLRKSAWWKHCHKLFQPGLVHFRGAHRKCLSTVATIDPYFLGVWFGDGRRDLKQGVQVSKPDGEIQQLCQDIANDYGLQLRVDDYGSCPTYRIVAERGQPNPLLDRMREVVEDVDRLPFTYLTADFATRAALLAGLLDTDGHYANGYFEIIQQRVLLAKDIAFLARSLGLRVVETVKHVEAPAYGSYAKLTIHGDATFLPMRIARKVPKPRRQKKDPLRTGFKVVPLGVGDYAGFELDGDGRFLLGDFTVTHNTEIACALNMALPCHWLFVVHRSDLMMQAARRWQLRTGTTELPGVVGDGTIAPDPNRRLTVATFQTLAKGLSKKDPRILHLLGDVEGLIVDECHVCPAASFWKVVMATRRAFYRVGLSGTPLARGDRRSVYAIAALGPVVYRVLPETLINLGVLARPNIRLVKLVQPLSTKTWDAAYRALVQDSPIRNRLIVEIAKRSKKPIFVFVKNVSHGKYLTDALNHHGVRAAFVWGEKATATREATVKQLRYGELDAIVCSVVFQEGIDVPELATVINAAGMNSSIAALQRIGRGMRSDGGKKPEVDIWDIYDEGNKFMKKHAQSRMRAYKKEGHKVEIVTPASVTESKVS